MWDRTLRRLYEIRQELMSGLGNGEIREALWARQYWAGADGVGDSGPNQPDERLDFNEVVRMCRRLNISSSNEELMRLFKARVHRFRYSYALTLTMAHRRRTLKTKAPWTFRRSSTSSSYSSIARS